MPVRQNSRFDFLFLKKRSFFLSDPNLKQGEKNKPKRRNKKSRSMTNVSECFPGRSHVIKLLLVWPSFFFLSSYVSPPVSCQIDKFIALFYAL